MKNVFKQIGDIKNNVDRSTFDWTHRNNFTTNIGRITPVFCERVPPKTSLRIDPAFALKFMPMMFPIQTPIKAYLSFYSVPIRTLWKDYKDFVSTSNDQLSDLEPPYIDFGSNPQIFDDGNILGVSGLSDYLGVPVNYNGGTSTSPISPITDITFCPIVATSGSYDSVSTSGVSTNFDIYDSWFVVANEGVINHKTGASNTLVVDDAFELLEKMQSFYFWWTNVDDSTSSTIPYNFVQPSLDVSANISLSINAIARLIGINQSSKIVYFNFEFGFTSDGINTDYEKSIEWNNGNLFCLVLTTNNGNSTDTQQVFTKIYPSEYKVTYDTANNKTTVYCKFDGFASPGNLIYLETLAINRSIFTSVISNPTAAQVDIIGGVNQIVGFKYLASSNDSSSVVTGNKLTFGTSPYYSSTENSKGLKLSAYPYRAYEAIYNAYIRNNKNNPFIKNGKKVYNEWITTDAGGADTTNYKLYKANWASDCFTTAVPSPQQGIAPLVGLTTYTTSTVNENGTTGTVLNTALVDEDGNKYKVNFTADGTTLKGVSYEKIDNSTPVNPVRNLMDLVSTGISINDFRVVNAYQRYLELNQFRGFSYKDIIEGRFDVDVRYDDLMMPEYLGGVTRDVEINSVTQTVETSSDGSYVGSLGSQAGNGNCFGSSDAHISCYCDEESYVIGIFYLVPSPVYTQVLPKHFLYRDRLDSFNPEFDHIGFQPITYKELCPIEAFNSAGLDSSVFDVVFGYQRPWYEYVQKVDTAHGLFRTQLRNFLMNRVFKSQPQLGSEFTTVDDESVNNVFSVTETTDKVLGQIYIGCTAKLPISRVVVPKLE